MAVGHAVEVIGKVDGNLSIKVLAAVDLGTNIGAFFPPNFVSPTSLPRRFFLSSQSKLTLSSRSDFNAVKAVVEATHKHKEIFYD